MIKADKWLLERVFEPLACEIESWTTINTWRVARFCVLVGLAADATYALGERTPLAYTSFGLGLIASGGVALISFAVERSMRRGLTANWLKHSLGLSCVRLLEFWLAGFSILSSLVGISSRATACRPKSGRSGNQWRRRMFEIKVVFWAALNVAWAWSCVKAAKRKR